MQQRLKVLVAGGGRVLLVAARERRVDVDASQRGHGLFAVCVRLLAEGQLGGRGGTGGFLRDEESDEEGNDHGTRPQEEGRARDEGSLRERETNKKVSCHRLVFHLGHNESTINIAVTFSVHHPSMSGTTKTTIWHFVQWSSTH